MEQEVPTPAPDAVDSAHAAFEGFPDHWQVVSRAIGRLQTDERVVGLYLSGSFAKATPDRWSDIDLSVVVADGTVDEVIASHQRLISEVGEIATSFPATHLGDPHQVIVFYRASEPIHVDYQYQARGALKPRQEDANVVILVDRDGALERWRDACRREPPAEGLATDRLEYLEVRFWGWCWYTHAKIERGELWEARDTLEYLRSHVLVPLTHREDKPFEGNRRLENKLAPHVQNLLASTVPVGHSASGYAAALDQVMHAYEDLFDALPVEDRAHVRQLDREYFAAAIRRHQRTERS